jgi:hypothetical protein
MTNRQVKSLRRAVLRALYNATGYCLTEEQVRKSVVASKPKLSDYVDHHFDSELTFLAEQGYIARYISDDKYHLEPVGITAVRSLIDLS